MNLICVALQKLTITFWDKLISEYFTEDATMKFTLWKDNKREEAKPFGTRSL